MHPYPNPNQEPPVVRDERIEWLRENLVWMNDDGQTMTEEGQAGHLRALTDLDSIERELKDLHDEDSVVDTLDAMVDVLAKELETLERTAPEWREWAEGQVSSDDS